MGDRVKLEMCTLKTITKVIKDITHSSCTTLEGTKYRYIIDCCKLDVGYVEHSYTKLMLTLKEKHSEVRFSTVLLINLLFEQFEHFRVLLIDSFSDFKSFTIPLKQDLPPPKKASDKLLEMTIRTIDNWHQKFGRAHPKLLEEYENLKSCNVDFEKCVIFNPTQRRKEVEEAQRSLMINKELLNKVTNEIRDMEPDINSCLASLETCFNLLVPFYNDSNENEPSDFRTNGMYHGTRVEIELANLQMEVIQNSENEAIIESLKESAALINKRYLPKIRAWKILIEKGDGESRLVEEASRYCDRLEQMLDKYHRLQVRNEVDHDDEVSTDSELEEVEEKCEQKCKQSINDDELSLFEKLQKQKCKISSSGSVEGNTKEEKPINNDLSTSKPKSDELTSRKKKLLQKAPVVRFDTDLYSWGEDKKTETLLPSSSDGHRFWAASEIDQVEVPLEMRRVIEFSGEFEEVKHKCRAKLPSGRLCPRQDRVKCPFHGQIIPRDDDGNPLDGCVDASTEKEKVPEWQEPALLARIKAETGIDLTIRKGRKVKQSALTPLKKVPTVRDKISKKVFDKRSVKRVAKALDSLDYRRHRDKFGDQFNYVHGSM